MPNSTLDSLTELEARLRKHEGDLDARRKELEQRWDEVQANGTRKLQDVTLGRLREARLQLTEFRAMMGW